MTNVYDFSLKSEETTEKYPTKTLFPTEDETLKRRPIRGSNRTRYPPAVRSIDPPFGGFITKIGLISLNL